jgi:hypothetical protein
MATNMETLFEKDQAALTGRPAKELLGSLIQYEQYVGEVWSIGYESALVMVHDKLRMDVGGIAGLSFLIATRIKKEDEIDYTKEDAAVILLRVMDAAPLPNAAEADRIRAGAAMQATEEPHHWDESKVMAGRTQNELSYAGVKCRVIGTFYMDKIAGEKLVLRFGGDLSNYYPNQGLKVYKPNGDGLKRIVNFRDPERIKIDENPLDVYEVRVGDVRYASTNRAFQGVSDVPVSIAPADLLAQKTALFGITRIGKSNTTKVIAKSVFGLRFKDEKQGRIGQLIFDAMGEYANVNVQDKTGKGNPSALKNVWKSHPKGIKTDVVTYGTFTNPNDPDRRFMLLNFYADENLQKGKEIIDAVLLDMDAGYIKNFRDITFEPPEAGDFSATKRYKRHVLAYRVLLFKAGLKPGDGMRASTEGLFNKELIEELETSKDDPDGSHASAAKVFQKPSPSWGALGDAFLGLRDFIKRGDKTGYQSFNQKYINRPKGSGEPWHDATLLNIMEIMFYTGWRRIGNVVPQHSPSVTRDYADDIYDELVAGKLVIVDQSSGEAEVNRGAAERVMWKIYEKNQEIFRNGKKPPSVLVYVEEAHNLLPSGMNLDEEARRNIWVKTAKEGSKLGIGFVYATQEVSSIHRNILKNTANWFIGHLNNTDETRELCKYYDFEDFEPSIRRAQDKGFLRVKTLSNLFVVPTQIDIFDAEKAIEA